MCPKKQFAREKTTVLASNQGTFSCKGDGGTHLNSIWSKGVVQRFYVAEGQKKKTPKFVITESVEIFFMGSLFGLQEKKLKKNKKPQNCL